MCSLYHLGTYKRDNILLKVYKRGISKEFIEKVDQLTERKKNGIRSRTMSESEIITLVDRINDLIEAQKERRKRTGNEEN